MRTVDKKENNVKKKILQLQKNNLIESLAILVAFLTVFGLFLKIVLF